jgi:hypothetical protein
MAINTGGFDVNVLPVYQPVDPSLAAFNPAQITHGVLDALQVGGTLQQIKAFKQHADEIAATEGIRTKLLQAQADQAAIKRDHEQAIKQAAIDDQLAQLSLTTAKAKAAGKNVEPSANLDLAKTNLALGDVAFQQKQQPTEQGVKSLVDAAALEAAPNVGLALVKKANTDLVNANLAYSKAVEDFKNGDTDAALLEKAKVASEQAKARLDDAQAKYYSGRNDAAVERSRITAEKVDTHTKAYNSLSQDYARSVQAYKNLLSEPAINPANPDDQRFTASKLVQAASVPDNPGFWKRLFGLGDTEPVPAFVVDKIKEINQARSELKAQEQVLKKVRDKISSSLVDGEAPAPAETTAPTPTSVVYWRNPATGKIEPKP